MTPRQARSAGPATARGVIRARDLEVILGKLGVVRAKACSATLAAAPSSDGWGMLLRLLWAPAWIAFGCSAISHQMPCGWPSSSLLVAR
jgi:hypothetical protein